MSLVLGLGLEHSCRWPREGLSSKRLSLALASDFFCVLGLGLEPCVLDSTSAQEHDLADLTYWIGRCAFNTNLSKSKTFLEKSLQIYEVKKISSENKVFNHHVAKIRYWIGRCLIKMKNFDEGKIHLEKAICIIESSSRCVLTNRDLASSNYWIGCTLYDSKKPVKAIEHFGKACRIYLTSSDYAKTDRDVANSNYWIGRCLLDIRRSSKAKFAFETALKIQKEICIFSFDNSINLDVANSTYWIGYCLLEMHLPKKVKFTSKNRWKCMKNYYYQHLVLQQILMLHVHRIGLASACYF